jgi:adenylate cyclase
MEQAVKSLERAAVVDPNDFQAWALLASILFGTGKDEVGALAATNAVERAKAHLKHNPGNARAAYLCSGCLHELGRTDEALEYMSLAAKASPRDPGVHYNRACLFARMGRHDEAVDALNQAIDNGFGQKAWIENDPDLDSIRNHERYTGTLERLDPS